MGYRNYWTHPRDPVRGPRRSFTRLKYTTTGKEFKGNLWQGLALAVQEFLVPGHLDGFELGFVGGRGVAGKTGEFGDPFVHVGEADGERIGVREFVCESDSDVFEIVPTECWRHVHSRKKFNTEGTEIAKKHGGINPPHGKINDRVPWRNSCSSPGFQRRCRWYRRE